ncbi:hypothetical protein L9F63_023194, partial [Diploptera punctata]
MYTSYFLLVGFITYSLHFSYDNLPGPSFVKYAFYISSNGSSHSGQIGVLAMIIYFLKVVLFPFFTSSYFFCLVFPILDLLLILMEKKEHAKNFFVVKQIADIFPSFIFPSLLSLPVFGLSFMLVILMAIYFCMYFALNRSSPATIHYRKETPKTFLTIFFLGNII